MRWEGQERQYQSAGQLGERFPSVIRLDLEMEFVSPQGHSLSSEHRSFQPNDTVDFSADCVGRCGNGRMDMESVVIQMINNRQTNRDTKGMCREILISGTSDTCNCELRCKISAEYRPLEEEPA